MAWKRTYCGLNSTKNPTMTPTKVATTYMMMHEQIQQVYSEASDDDEFWGSETIVPILVRLICRFDHRILKTGASYTRVRLTHEYIE